MNYTHNGPAFTKHPDGSFVKKSSTPDEEYPTEWAMSPDDVNGTDVIYPNVVTPQGRFVVENDQHEAASAVQGVLVANYLADETRRKRRFIEVS
ncbi:MAG: hypothetical protein Q7R81_07130 [Candidatus Peregrinibacteria bacterium]|nr:hypothetical protein [Candidatus Peregrinibacteria bacterium]